MGLGIKTYDTIYTSYSIPLIWDDNKILADHLRYLADEIEALKKPIIEVKLSTPISNAYLYKPCLEIITMK
jgi:hypothetical protein